MDSERSSGPAGQEAGQSIKEERGKEGVVEAASECVDVGNNGACRSAQGEASQEDEGKTTKLESLSCAREECGVGRGSEEGGGMRERKPEASSSIRDDTGEGVGNGRGSECMEEERTAKPGGSSCAESRGREVMEEEGEPSEQETTREDAECDVKRDDVDGDKDNLQATALKEYQVSLVTH